MPLNRRRRAPVLQSSILEALEPRTLLTVDFSGAFINPPVAVLSGTKQNLTVAVTNNGSTRYSGPLTMQVYAEPDGQLFDPHAAKLLLTTSRAAAIGSGSTQNFTLAVPVNPALEGSYDFYAVLDSAGRITETDETNNVAATPAVSVVPPNYDLVCGFGANATLVPGVVSGVATNASLAITVTNSVSSTVTIPAGVSVAVQVVARPVDAVDASQDIVLNRRAVNVLVGGLAHGKGRNAAVAIQFPANMSLGNYDIVLKVDTGSTLAEADETNNEATFGHTVTDAAPFGDLGVSFGPKVIIPADVVADNRALPLTIDLTNEGNTTIPAGTTASLSIIAHGLSDTTLKTFAVTIGGLMAGKMKPISVSPTILSSLGDDSYEIEAVLTTGLNGDDAGNNTATADGAMNISTAYYNIAAVAPTTQIAPAVLSGTPVPGFVNVGITNLSNTSLPPGQRASVSLVLRPVGEDDSANDIPVTTTSVPIGGMLVGKTQSFRIGVTVPAKLPNGNPIPLGNYEWVSTITPVNLTETSDADDGAIGGVINIANAFGDLAINSASSNFPLPSAIGGTAVGTVVLRNTGNLRIQGPVTVQFFATPTLNINAGFSIGSSTFVVNLLPGQTSLPLNTALQLTIPANGQLAANYNVYARIDPSSFTDADGANNQLAAGTIVVSTQHVDLRLVSAGDPFSGIVGAGQTATSVVTIGNFGSGVSVGPVTINYYLCTGTTINGNAILIGTTVTQVALGAAQITGPVGVDLTMISRQGNATFNLIAQITAASDIDNNANDNVTTVLGTINYQGPPVT